MKIITTPQYEHLTTIEIAQLEGVSAETVNDWRRACGVVSKGNGWGSNKAERPFKGVYPQKRELPKIDDPKIWNNREWLYNAYVIKGLGYLSICKMVGRQRETIKDKLKKWGIPTRTLFQASRSKNPFCNPAWLEEHYITLGLSLGKCAELANVNPYTIYNWLVNFNIPIRDKYESAARR